MAVARNSKDFLQQNHLDGVTITKGTVATIKQEVGYIYDRNKPDGHVYILSLSSTVIKSGKVKLADGTTKTLKNLKNKDVIDISQLVLLECIFHDYDGTGKTLYLTYQNSYDIANGQYPSDYVGADGGTTHLVE